MGIYIFLSRTVHVPCAYAERFIRVVLLGVPLARGLDSYRCAKHCGGTEVPLACHMHLRLSATGWASAGGRCVEARLTVNASPSRIAHLRVSPQPRTVAQTRP